MVEYTIYDEQEQPVVVELSAGDVIFVSAGCFHSAKATVKSTVVAGIVFPITFFDMKPFHNIHKQSIYPIIQSGVKYIDLSADSFENELILSGMKELFGINEQETTYELHCIEIVCRIWRLLTVRIEAGKKNQYPIVSKSIQSKHLKEIIDFIHTHFNEHISVEDMAKAATISRTKVFRCFHSVLQKKPVEYLTEYRLSMAALQLVNTEKTLSDIASSCGFNSQSYFGKVFREQCGLSPKKYREQFQKMV